MQLFHLVKNLFISTIWTINCKILCWMHVICVAHVIKCTECRNALDLMRLKWIYKMQNAPHAISRSLAGTVIDCGSSNIILFTAYNIYQTIEIFATKRMRRECISRNNRHSFRSQWNVLCDLVCRMKVSYMKIIK